MNNSGETIDQRLRGLLDQLSDRLPKQDRILAFGYIEAGQHRMGLEHMTGAMADENLPVITAEHHEMSALADTLGAEAAAGHLAECPRV